MALHLISFCLTNESRDALKEALQPIVDAHSKSTMYVKFTEEEKNLAIASVKKYFPEGVIEAVQEVRDKGCKSFIVGNLPNIPEECLEIKFRRQLQVDAYGTYQAVIAAGMYAAVDITIKNNYPLTRNRFAGKLEFPGDRIHRDGVDILAVAIVRNKEEAITTLIDMDEVQKKMKGRLNSLKVAGGDMPLIDSFTRKVAKQFKLGDIVGPQDVIDDFHRLLKEYSEEKIIPAGSMLVFNDRKLMHVVDAGKPELLSQLTDGQLRLGLSVDGMRR